MIPNKRRNDKKVADRMKAMVYWNKAVLLIRNHKGGYPPAMQIHTSLCHVEIPIIVVRYSTSFKGNNELYLEHQVQLDRAKQVLLRIQNKLLKLGTKPVLKLDTDESTKQFDAAHPDLWHTHYSQTVEHRLEFHIM
jgi:hypothetical protein